jgi:anti-sigma factor ChrR (cupin superfamily)
MLINADFSLPAIVVPKDDDWQCSPESGVDRLMLDRIGEEVARATSIVRYAKGSSFPRHLHAKGEEFLVLSGIFSDEHGDYPAGCYVRNPPGSGHSPFSIDGCRILVKLRQFDAADLTPVVVHTRDSTGWEKGKGGFTEVLHLYDYGSEQVQMIRIAAGQSVPLAGNSAGVEVLVVDGSVRYADQLLPAESWLRFPADYIADIAAVTDTVLWMKKGHLSLLLPDRSIRG